MSSLLSAETENDKYSNSFSPDWLISFFTWQETNEIVAIKKFKDSEGRKINPVFFSFIVRLFCVFLSFGLIPLRSANVSLPLIPFSSPRRKWRG